MSSAAAVEPPRQKLVRTFFISMAGAGYLLSGLGLVVFGLPVMLPGRSHPGHFEEVGWALWLWLFALPGCVHAVVRAQRGGGANPWMRFSLWGALLGSAGAVGGGWVMGVFYPLGIIGFLGSSVLLYSLDEIRRRSLLFQVLWWAGILVMSLLVGGFMTLMEPQTIYCF